MGTRKLCAIVVVFLSACWVGTSNADIWYVDRDNVSGIQDGRSWSTAFTTIQPAIDAAANDLENEVWIAEGTYNEDRTQNETTTIWGSLELRDGVRLYGGFNGSETERSQRNTLRYRSIIDGFVAKAGEPSRRVVVAANRTTIDGCTIRGGGADTGGFGAAISVWEVSDVEIAGCRIVDNPGDGVGAMTISDSHNVVVERTLFARNGTLDTTYYAAIWVRFHSSDVVLKDNLFVENAQRRDSLAQIFSGVVYVEDSEVELTRSAFIRNSGQPLTWETRQSQNVLVSECDFVGNDAGDASGGMFILRDSDELSESISIDRCVLSSNRGGASLISVYGPPIPLEISPEQVYIARVKNSVIANNDVTDLRGYPYGPLIVAGDGSLEFNHCSIVGNYFWARIAVGAMVFRDFRDGAESRLAVRNSIIWNERSEVEFYDRGDPDYYLPRIDNSIVRGGFDGYGNYDAEPLFRDLESGDFRLDPSSPGVDWLPAGITVQEDVFGSPRPGFEFPDMGAYEFHRRVPTSCESSELIEERLSQFRLMSDEYTDLDDDGLPEIAALRLLAEAACQYSTSQGIAAERAFELNMQMADIEPFDMQILRRQHLIAAWMSVGPEAQQTVRDALAESDVALAGDYAVVACDESGNCDAVLPGSRDVSMVDTPYSGPGDFDGDGLANADEWAFVMAAGGSVDDFVAAAMDPNVRSTSVSASGSCFIATAAYGTPLAAELDTLRAFRDDSMLTGPLGSTIADLYYRLSPPAADTIARHDTLRGVTRRILEPVVNGVRWRYERNSSERAD